jgi:hypothetical protein
VNCDYRVIKHRDASKGEEWVGVHAVFHDEGGAPISYSQEPESCAGTSIEDLRLRAEMMKDACDKDLLEASSLDASIGRKRKSAERKVARNSAVCPRKVNSPRA